MAQPSVSPWGQLLNCRHDPEQPYSPRHDRRVWVRYPCDVEATCQAVDLPDDPKFPGRVRNISRGGINLLLAGQKVERGTLLSVVLPSPIGQTASTFLACVLHCVEEPGGGWSVGCTFVIELNGMHQFTEHGGVNGSERWYAGREGSNLSRGAKP